MPPILTAPQVRLDAIAVEANMEKKSGKKLTKQQKKMVYQVPSKGTRFRVGDMRVRVRVSLLSIID